MRKNELAQMIDHTALTAEKTEEDIRTLCNEAKKYNFFSVCINSCYIPLAKEVLKDSNVKICTVIGFPLGANLTSVKVFEARESILAGANEIDMVANIGWIKSQHWDLVQNDIQSVLYTCHNKAHLKVILETCLLTEDEIITICRICKDLGVDFVKTSTGFNKEGATVKNIQLMRRTVGQQVGVKASGGIKNTKIALDMINAGANRIGASAGIDIIQGLSDTNNI
ncbi:deoxyribose-phosphate aldolase [Gallibacterium sp. AGMB14963]|uniref:deoxyribose-phosphate aldolase n=1 Tax=Gallibacterium faecale TaxID=3019086 RepID=UPI0022F16799|nr:deoxyribose-phosphate aldolase [Gallibacterium sp. AGMB14963]MDA3977643.1 deoxyribose-phosphate aldolase [Gallibacterium sp. AGMB14963]